MRHTGIMKVCSSPCACTESGRQSETNGAHCLEMKQTTTLCMSNLQVEFSHAKKIFAKMSPMLYSIACFLAYARGSARAVPYFRDVTMHAPNVDELPRWLEGASQQLKIWWVCITGR